MITAIIGANYGDEGKGLAVNYFTREGKNLVVRHNGGAQSGHTVESGDKRFVFHELSSGSFNGAATYWEATYHPDLYTLGTELGKFYSLTHTLPQIYCNAYAKITTIDDVLINCYKESAWHKFGSCGMGIWECVCRNNAGYAITVKQVNELTVEQLYALLVSNRENYSKPLLKRLSADPDNAYVQMLSDNTILRNYAVEIKQNLKNVTIISHLRDIIDSFDNIVFESGQGLLLDGDYDTEHGTPSKTGIINITNSLEQVDRSLDEVVYVTRTYLTRHGRGNFVNEIDLGYEDVTNHYNEWQEGVRYGKFETLADLEKRVNADSFGLKVKPHILVTHANVTNGKFLTDTGTVDIADLDFEKIYVSDNRQTVNDVIMKGSL